MLNWRAISKFYWSLPYPVITSRISTWITGPFSLWGVWSGCETNGAFLLAHVFMWPTLSLVWAQLTNVCTLFSVLFQFLGHEWQTWVKWLISLNDQISANICPDLLLYLRWVLNLQTCNVQTAFFALLACNIIKSEVIVISWRMIARHADVPVKEYMGTA